MDVQDLMKKATIFHGHICPGVALGVLVAKYILNLGFEHSLDEELVAVVENDNCSVDAIQALLGTTYGKGNLIHLDYGKNNYTIYSRKSQRGVRFALKSSIFGNKKLSRDERIKKLLSSNPEEIFDIREVEFNPPERAQIEESISCEICNELTMSSRIVDYQGTKMCIPCYKTMKK
ncbi:MAG: FmdE family protein [Candidatus Odinarchaeota archaeon]